MFAIAILVAGLVIAALSWAAVRRSDAEDVSTKNNKPSDNRQNDLVLSRGREHTRENVREADQAKLSEPQKQDHIQYLDQPHIRSMLARAEAETERKVKAKRSLNDRLREMFGDLEKHPLDLDVAKGQQRERDRGMER